MTVLLCNGCDAIRDQERAFCHSCEEQTGSYRFEPTEREETAFTRLVVHPVHGFAVVDA